MNVSCEKCNTDYDLEESRIGESGLTVKCTHCGHIFEVHGEEDDPFSDGPLGSMEIETPKLGAWRVRRRSGEELSFDDFATLRRWIVERRVAREDQISKTGDNWKPIGSIIELASLFDDAGPLIEAPPRAEDGPPPPVAREDLLDVDDSRLAGLDAKSDLIASSMFDPMEIKSALDSRETPREELSAAPAIISAEDDLDMLRPPPLPARNTRTRPASGPPPVVQAPPRRFSDRSSMHARLPAPPRRPSGARIGSRESVVGRPPPRASVNRLPAHRDSVPNLRAVDAGVPRRRESMVGPRRRLPPGAHPGGPGAPGGPGGRPAAPGELGMSFEGEAPPAYVNQANGGTGRGFLMGVLTMLALAGVGYFVYDNYIKPDEGTVVAPTPPVTPQGDGVAAALARAEAAYALDTELGLTRSMQAWDEALGALGTPPRDPAQAGRAHIGRAKVALARAEYALVDGDQATVKAQLGTADRALAVARTLGQDVGPLQLAMADYHRINGEVDLARNYLDQVREVPAVAAERALIEAALGLHGGKPAEAADQLGMLAAEVKALPRAAWLHAVALKMAERTAEARGATEALLAVNQGHEPARRLLASLPPAADEVADAGVPDAATPEPDAAAPKPAPKPKPKPKPKPATPTGSFDSLMDRGNALLERGKAREARKHFLAASKARPRSPEPWASLGWCELDARNYQKAIKHFDQALRQNPRYADGMYGQATAYERAGMKTQAKQAYQAYLNVHPRGSKAAIIRRKLANMP